LSTIDYDLGAGVEPHFRRLREEWETPNGVLLTEALEVWRVARQLACGLIYRWEPAPPEDWLLARRAWGRFVRETLKDSRTYDTEMQVAKACKRGELDASAYEGWAAIRKSYEYEVVPEWLDDGALNFCATWLDGNERGICWVEHTWFGKRLSEITGLPYFGEGGKVHAGPARGVGIEDARGPIIASIASNSEGRNLQAWDRNLIISPPPTGKDWEQLLGRTHRFGQEAEEVEAEVACLCLEQWSSLQQAIADARYTEQTTGQQQKLVLADKDLPGPEDVARWQSEGRPLWAK
jgi:hypothetical protein